MADVGTGGTITFGTSGFTASIISIEPGEITREVIDTSHLGTTGGRTKIPGDLYDPGDLTLTFQYNPDTQPPYSGSAETITVTYPIDASNSTGATLAGSGFVSSFTPGAMNVDELMEAECTVTWSGNLTFTDGAPS